MNRRKLAVLLSVALLITSIPSAPSWAAVEEAIETAAATVAESIEESPIGKTIEEVLESNNEEGSDNSAEESSPVMEETTAETEAAGAEETLPAETSAIESIEESTAAIENASENISETPEEFVASEAEAETSVSEASESDVVESEASEAEAAESEATESEATESEATESNVELATLSYFVKGIKIEATGMFEAGTELVVEVLDEASLSDGLKEAVSEIEESHDEDTTTEKQFNLDIMLKDAEGNEFEPTAENEMSLTFTLLDEYASLNHSVDIIHEVKPAEVVEEITDDGKVEEVVIKEAEIETFEDLSLDINAAPEGQAAVTIETEGLSPIVVIVSSTYPTVYVDSNTIGLMKLISLASLSDSFPSIASVSAVTTSNSEIKIQADGGTGITDYTLRIDYGKSETGFITITCDGYTTAEVKVVFSTALPEIYINGFPIMATYASADGKARATYSSAEHTLTIEGDFSQDALVGSDGTDYSVTTTIGEINGSGIYYCGTENLTIVIADDATISNSGNSYGIYSSPSITINNEGLAYHNLYIGSNKHGVCTNKDLYIKGFLNVNISSTQIQSNFAINANGNVSIDTSVSMDINNFTNGINAKQLSYNNVPSENKCSTGYIEINVASLSCSFNRAPDFATFMDTGKQYSISVCAGDSPSSCSTVSEASISDVNTYKNHYIKMLYEATTITDYNFADFDPSSDSNAWFKTEGYKEYYRLTISTETDAYNINPVFTGTESTSSYVISPNRKTVYIKRATGASESYAYKNIDGLYLQTDIASSGVNNYSLYCYYAESTSSTAYADWSKLINHVFDDNLSNFDVATLAFAVKATGSVPSYGSSSDAFQTTAIKIIPGGYPLYISGRRVNSVNQDDVLGDGKIKYISDTNTLELNNATIDTSSTYGIYYCGDSLFNISASGSNSISGTTAIYSESELSISSSSSDASICINSSNTEMGIGAEAGITNNATITMDLNSSLEDVFGIATLNGRLKNNGIINIKISGQHDTFGGIYIASGSLVNNGNITTDLSESNSTNAFNYGIRLESGNLINNYNGIIQNYSKTISANCIYNDGILNSTINSDLVAITANYITNDGTINAKVLDTVDSNLWGIYAIQVIHDLDNEDNGTIHSIISGNVNTSTSYDDVIAISIGEDLINDGVIEAEIIPDNNKVFASDVYAIYTYGTISNSNKLTGRIAKVKAVSAAGIWASGNIYNYKTISGVIGADSTIDDEANGIVSCATIENQNSLEGEISSTAGKIGDSAIGIQAVNLINSGTVRGTVRALDVNGYAYGVCIDEIENSSNLYGVVGEDTDDTANVDYNAIGISANNFLNNSGYIEGSVGSNVKADNGFGISVLGDFNNTKASVFTPVVTACIGSESSKKGAVFDESAYGLFVEGTLSNTNGNINAYIGDNTKFSDYSSVINVGKDLISTNGIIKANFFNDTIDDFDASKNPNVISNTSSYGILTGNDFIINGGKVYAVDCIPEDQVSYSKSTSVGIFSYNKIKITDGATVLAHSCCASISVAVFAKASSSNTAIIISSNSNVVAIASNTSSVGSVSNAFGILGSKKIEISEKSTVRASSCDANYSYAISASTVYPGILSMEDLAIESDSYVFAESGNASNGDSIGILAYNLNIDNSDVDAISGDSDYSESDNEHGYSSGIYTYGDITITDSLVDAKSTSTKAKNGSYGIFTKENIFVDNESDLDILSGIGSISNAIYADGDLNATDSEIGANAGSCTDEPNSYAVGVFVNNIYSSHATINAHSENGGKLYSAGIYVPGEIKIASNSGLYGYSSQADESYGIDVGNGIEINDSRVHGYSGPASMSTIGINSGKSILASGANILAYSNHNDDSNDGVSYGIKSNGKIISTNSSISSNSGDSASSSIAFYSKDGIDVSGKKIQAFSLGASEDSIGIQTLGTLSIANNAQVFGVAIKAADESYGFLVEGDIIINDSWLNGYAGAASKSSVGVYTEGHIDSLDSTLTGTSAGGNANFCTSIYSWNDINVSGGEIKASANDGKDANYGVVSLSTISISDATVSVTSYDSSEESYGIGARNIHIEQSNVESSSGIASNSYAFICTDNITFGKNNKITAISANNTAFRGQPQYTASGTQLFVAKVTAGDGNTSKTYFDGNAALMSDSAGTSTNSAMDKPKVYSENSNVTIDTSYGNVVAYYSKEGTSLDSLSFGNDTTITIPLPSGLKSITYATYANATSSSYKNGDILDFAGDIRAVALYKYSSTNKSSGGGSSGGGGSSHSSSGGGGGGSSRSKTQTVVTGPVSGPLITGAVSGTWTYNTVTNQWSFRSSSGQSYVNQWAYINNMGVEAYQEPTSWYYFDEKGIMVTGWRWIRCIDGFYRCFYMNEKHDGVYGRLYRNEMTPDGYTVDASGYWTVNEVIQTKTSL